MPRWEARFSRMPSFTRSCRRRSTKSPPDWSRWRRVSDEQVTLVESQGALEQLIASVNGEALLGADTEAASFHRYHDRVYLIQLSSRTRTAVIDPLAIEDLAPFGRILADPTVEVVFHDADYDLRLLDQQYGFRAAHVFDTRVAAQLLNEP